MYASVCIACCLCSVFFVKVSSESHLIKSLGLLDQSAALEKNKGDFVAAADKLFQSS